MKLSVARILPLLVLLFASCSEDDITLPGNPKPSDYEQLLIDDLEQIITPVSTDSPNAPFGELTGLDGLAEARIIGMGEASHGTSEFFHMKDRLLRYFSQQHGFRSFSIEADFGESIFFDRYIRGEMDGNLEDLMDEKMNFWTWNTAEVRDMIEWMRSYNNGLDPADQLRYFGVDCQYPKHNVDLLVEYMANYDSDFSDSLQFRLADIRDLQYSETDTDSDRDLVLADLQYLRIGVEDRADQIVSGGSIQVYNLMLQLVKVVEQCEQVQWAYAKTPGSNPRDTFMAENAIWVLDYLGPDEKSMLWAHNLHVNNIPTWGAMGQLLRNELGDDYQIIGFAFSQGTLSAVDPDSGLRTHSIQEDPKTGSLNRVLHFAGADNYFFHTEEVAYGSDLYSWLVNDQPDLMNIGSVYNGVSYNYYYPVQLLQYYDVMIYFDTGSASDRL